MISSMQPQRRALASWWVGVTILFALLLTLSNGFFLAPAPTTYAQQDMWRELQTDQGHFIVLYTTENLHIAQIYADFADDVYEEMATLFQHRTKTPITLRLYPTQESYYEVNPLASRMPGIVAHADFRHREVAVLLPQTARQLPEEVVNNVRHELTHIIAADITGNRLNTGFQEGIAQYVERNSPEIENKIRALERAYTNNELLSWSDFDNRETVYSNVMISYPQSLSVISFLIEQYGFEQFRDFLTISAKSSGYRSALNRTYGISPTKLEEQWREWLPTYFAGGYLSRTVAGYDLSTSRSLVAAGRYDEANQALTQALEWMHAHPEGDEMTSAPDAEMLAEAEELLWRSREGLDAQQHALDARAALEAGDYISALDHIDAARARYAGINDMRQQEVLTLYAERAHRGMQAQEQLNRAQQHYDSLSFLESRDAAAQAAAAFAAIGDQAGFARAQALHESLDGSRRLLGFVLIGAGVLGVVLSTISRLFMRQTEIW